MTVLITMAGVGSRFKERGYRPPKYRIMARGRTLMEWSLMSLQAFLDQPFIFACLDEGNEEWIRATAATLGIADVTVAKRSGASRGQAETAFDALAHADPVEPLWIYNIDTRVAPNAMRPQDLGMAMGCVPVFQCSESNMSFVRFGSCYDVIEIAEKRPISSWATVGLYGFRSAAYFAKQYRDAYEQDGMKSTPEERYVAPMYKTMIINGERVVAPRLNRDDVSILGTPAQILTFDPSAHPPFGNSTWMS